MCLVIPLCISKGDSESLWHPVHTQSKWEDAEVAWKHQESRHRNMDLQLLFYVRFFFFWWREKKKGPYWWKVIRNRIGTNWREPTGNKMSFYLLQIQNRIKQHFHKEKQLVSLVAVYFDVTYCEAIGTSWLTQPRNRIAKVVEEISKYNTLQKFDPFS